MKIKLKKKHSHGIIRLEAHGEIKEVVINEDLLSPEKEIVKLCFRGPHSSGIVELTPEEVDLLSKQLQGKTKLVKTMKIYKK